MKTALVTGIFGQDGANLAKLVLRNGYCVAGTSRDAEVARFTNLDRLGIRNLVQTWSLSP